jgi:hypothetical protein
MLNTLVSEVELNRSRVLVVSGEARLRHILKTCAAYYKGVRAHLSLGKDVPNVRRSEAVGNIMAVPILGGLHHLYVRV